MCWRCGRLTSGVRGRDTTGSGSLCFGGELGGLVGHFDFRGVKSRFETRWINLIEIS